MLVGKPIGLEGGTVYSTHSRAAFTLPPGTQKEETVFSVTARHLDELNLTNTPSLTPVGPVMEIRPSPIHFGGTVSPVAVPRTSDRAPFFGGDVMLANTTPYRASFIIGPVAPVDWDDVQSIGAMRERAWWRALRRYRLTPVELSLIVISGGRV